MMARIGKTFTFALLIAVVAFIGLNVFNDGNVALAAGPVCSAPDYAAPLKGGKGQVHIEYDAPKPTGDLFGVLVDYVTGMTEQGILDVAYRQEWFLPRSGGNVYGHPSVDTGRYAIVMHFADAWVVAGLIEVHPNQQNRPLCWGNPTAAVEEVVEVAPAPSPTVTPPTEPVTPTAEADAIVDPTVDPCARMRKGPGTDFERVTCLAPGKALTVIGKNADGSWVRHKSDAGTGWTSAELLTVNVDMAGVPIVEVAPPAEVAAGAIVTPTVPVTPTIAVTPAVKSLCDRCWEIGFETSVGVGTIDTAAKLNRPITMNVEVGVITIPIDGAELLLYIEGTTVLSPHDSTSIDVEHTASSQGRGVKYTIQDGDTVEGILKQVRGEGYKVTAEEILELVTGNPDAFEMVIDGGGNIVVLPVPGAQILFGCPV